MMKIILIFLLCLSLHAKTLKVGYSSNLSSSFSIKNYIKIIECTFKGQDLKYTEFPGLRLKDHSDEIDVIFPVPKKSSKQYKSVWPFYIEEIVRLTNPLSSQNNTVGVVRGSYENYHADSKKYDISFQPTNYENLYSGLAQKRVRSVITKGNLVPNVLYDNYDIKREGLHISAMGINRNLDLDKIGIKDLESTLKKCIVENNYSLSISFKDEILKKITPFLNTLQKTIVLDKRKVKNIKEVEKSWSSNTKYQKRILSNQTSKYLRKLTGQYSFVKELFVMNFQGALVSSSFLTSDFDQSDEYKYKILKKLRRNGFSLDNIGAYRFDESRSLFLLETYIPLYNNSKAKLLGGVYIGIDVNKLLF